MDLAIPRGLDWLRTTDAGRAWLDELPMRVAATARRWRLRLNDPYPDSHVSLVVPAVRNGEGFVLKMQFPHRESEHEATALRNWNGNGAVSLIEYDPESHALLLERCVPGDHLAGAGPEIGLATMIDLLPRLWVRAGQPYGSLTAEVDRWVVNLPVAYEEAGEPFDRGMLEEAVYVLTDLAANQGEQVLLHQDLHGGNVLRAKREPWLAIDPKPLTGEREFGLSPIIRSHEFGHNARAVLDRLDRMTGELGVDRERSRLWAFGQAIAWAFEDGGVLRRHIETARWLLNA